MQCELVSVPVAVRLKALGADSGTDSGYMTQARGNASGAEPKSQAQAANDGGQAVTA